MRRRFTEFDFQTDDADRPDEDEQPFFPVTHEVDLKHGTKSVSCLSIDTQGERLVSGGFDYQMKMWDFATMDKTVQYHRAISPCESHQLRSIEFSPGNDMLLIASGSCQGKVINRDGKTTRLARKKKDAKKLFFRQNDLRMCPGRHVSG